MNNNREWTNSGARTMAVHGVFAVGARVMRLRSQLLGQRLGTAPDTYNPSTWAKLVDAGIEQAVSVSEKESFCVQ